MGGMFKEDEAHVLRQMHSGYIEVWDTGQQAHMVQGAKVDNYMVDQSAFFGWCTNVRGTNAGGDATSLGGQAGQDMVGHGHPQQQYGERDHLGQTAGQDSHSQQQEGHDHMRLTS